MQILNSIQLTRTPFLDSIMRLVSNGIVLWLLLPMLLFIRRNTRRAGFIVLLAVVLEMILCNLIMKNMFQRDRLSDRGCTGDRHAGCQDTWDEVGCISLLRWIQATSFLQTVSMTVLFNSLQY